MPAGKYQMSPGPYFREHNLSVKLYDKTSDQMHTTVSTNTWPSVLIAVTVVLP